MNTNEEVQKVMSGVAAKVLEKMIHIIIKNTNYMNIVSN